MRAYKNGKISILSLLFLSVSAISITAQTIGFSPSLNQYGTTGLIDMPTAESQPDAELNTTLSSFAGATKGSFTFQVLPRISGTFRYARIDNWKNGDNAYDRSFDLQYRIFDETLYTPSIAVGMRDFMGTGIYSGQYFVATKNIAQKFKISTGIGWGRFSNSNTYQKMPRGDLGGKPLIDQWFTGPSGIFGGVEWQTPIDQLRLKLEYSSDFYAPENELTSRRNKLTFDRKSSLNIGATYKSENGYQVGLYYMYGSEIGLTFSTALNPKRGVGRKDPAPIPIAIRPKNFDKSTSWVKELGINQKAQNHLNSVLNKDGIFIESLQISGQSVELRLRNQKYHATPQAIGRTARAMAYVFPDSVTTFIIIPVEKGMPTSAITLKRRDLENLENHPNASHLIAQRIDISDAKPMSKNAKIPKDLYPNLSWSLAPYATLKVFDSTDPFAINAGLRASAHYDIMPGLSFNGSITKKIIKSEKSPSPSSSGLYPVRTNIGYYNIEGDPALERLTVDYFFKVSPSIYGRMSAGYLETMYGGVSAEILWKPVEKSWGLGVEINHVKQRNFNQRFGFKDYSVVTGHISGYFELPNGFEAQIDIGRYLAKDIGATISLDRTFDNGWRIGGYATVTNVSSEEFGEGSFDKGIRLEIPLGWALGTASRKTIKNNLASLVRDGGARLNVQNRLYGVVKNNHKSALSGSWGRFWK